MFQKEIYTLKRSFYSAFKTKKIEFIIHFFSSTLTLYRHIKLCSSLFNRFSSVRQQMSSQQWAGYFPEPHNVIHIAILRPEYSTYCPMYPMMPQGLHDICLTLHYL